MYIMNHRLTYFTILVNLGLIIFFFFFYRSTKRILIHYSLRSQIIRIMLVFKQCFRLSSNFTCFSANVLRQLHPSIQSFWCARTRTPGGNAALFGKVFRRKIMTGSNLLASAKQDRTSVIFFFFFFFFLYAVVLTKIVFLSFLCNTFICRSKDWSFIYFLNLQ